MTLVRIHQPDMFIINTRETDEVHHLTIRNRERRILALFVLPEMIIIIGKERKIGGILNQLTHAFCRGINEKQLGKIRLQYSLASAIDVFQDMMQREINLCISMTATVDDIIVSFLLPVICCPQNKPLFGGIGCMFQV